MWAQESAKFGARDLCVVVCANKVMSQPLLHTRHVSQKISTFPRSPLEWLILAQKSILMANFYPVGFQESRGETQGGTGMGSKERILVSRDDDYHSRFVFLCRFFLFAHL
jgi:hypothetical protein